MDFEPSTEKQITERILRHALTFLCTYKLNRTVADAPVDDAIKILLTAMYDVDKGGA